MATPDLTSYLNDYATQNGVDPTLMQSIAQQESGGNQYNPDGSIVTSQSGAKGIFQLLPSTAADYGENPNDPLGNIRGAVKHVAWIQSKYGSDPSTVATVYHDGSGNYDSGNIGPKTQAYAAAVAAGVPSQPKTDWAAWSQGNDAPPQQDSSQPQPTAPPTDWNAWSQGQDGSSQAPSAQTPSSPQSGAGYPFVDAITGKPLPLGAAKTAASMYDEVKKNDAIKASQNLPYMPFRENNGQDMDGIVYLKDPSEEKNVLPNQYYLMPSADGTSSTLMRMGADGKGFIPNAGVDGFVNSAAYAFNKPFENMDRLANWATGGNISPLNSFVQKENSEEANNSDKAQNGVLPKSTLGGITGSILGLAPLMATGAGAADLALPDTVSTFLSGASRGGLAVPSSITAGVLGGASGGALTTNATNAQGVARDAVNGGVVGGALGLGGNILGAAGTKLAATPWGQSIPIVRNLVPSADQIASGVLEKMLPQGSDAVWDRTAPTAAETMGQNGVRQAAVLARKNPTIGNLATDLMDTRAIARPVRITDQLGDITGIDPATARGGQEAAVQAGQQAAAPLYQRALSSPGGVWSDPLASLSGRPEVKSALNQAFDDIRNGGGNPLGPVVEPDGMGGLVTTQNAPTAQAWDLTKKYLNQAVSRDPITGRVITTGPVGIGNQFLNKAQNDLTGVLRDPQNGIPGYAEALDAGADYAAPRAAYEKGADMFAAGTPTADFNNFFNGLNTEGEKQAARAAILNDIYEKAQNSTLGKNTLRPKDFATGAAGEKLATAFGDQAPQIQSLFNNENNMMRTEQLVTPRNGSQTAPLMMGDEDLTKNIASLASMGKNVMYFGHHPIGLGILGAKAISMLPDARSSAAQEIIGRKLLGSPDDMAEFIRQSRQPMQPNVFQTTVNPIWRGLIGSAAANIANNN